MPKIPQRGSVQTRVTDADRIVRLSAATHTVTTVPRAKLLVYDGVGHAVQFDAPQRFGRDLSEFVRATRRNRR